MGLAWVIVWAVIGGFYLFLAGDLGPFELVSGAICATVGVALAIGLHRVAHRRLAVVFPPVKAILRPLAALGPETVWVGRELAAEAFGRSRGQRGAFVRQDFDPGAAHDPASATRRALAVLGVSLAPGSFVIRGDRLPPMILHALPPRPASTDIRWPA